MSSSSSAAEEVVVEVEDPPKLKSWRVVCWQLYTPTERARLVGNPRECVMGIHVTFLSKLITGELFQTPNDWEDLQRRLRAHGYSDDLTGLKHAMIPPAQHHFLDHHGDVVPTGSTGTTTTTTTTTTTDTATSTRTATSMAGQKRSVMDCHGENQNENGNHQDHPNNHADDHETWRKKLKFTLHDRLKRSANRLVSDTNYSSKIRLLMNLKSALYRMDAHQKLHSPSNPVPMYRNDAPAGTAVVIPQDPGEASTMAESIAATPDAGWSPCRECRTLASAVQSAIRDYQANYQDSSFLGQASSTRRKDVPLAVVHNHRAETVPANFVARHQGGLATSNTIQTTLPPPFMADTRKSSPAASFSNESFHPSSMDLTKTGNDVIPSNVDRTQGMIVGDGTTTTTTTATTATTRTTMNIITQDYNNDNVVLDTPEKKSVTTDHDFTSSPTKEQMEEPVLSHPIDVADIGTVVPTEPKETPLVMEDCMLNSQDQNEEEEEEAAESSSMINSADDNTTTTAVVVVPPDVSNPHQGGLFRNLMITSIMMVWSISLHLVLWTLLETTDYQLWRRNRSRSRMNEPYNIPLRVCLSMESIRQPHLHSLATVPDSNPNHEEPWLGRDEGDDTLASPTTMMSWHNSSSSIHLHRLCSPWYSVMSLTLGVLFSMWIITKLFKKKKN